ncbi:MAG: hypothetical protein IKG85_06495, partial [Clostridia bacterium]|nr:hypothetical protein [Clostridia bacterium]
LASAGFFIGVIHMLGYAFTWLTNSEEEKIMFGKLNLEEFTGLTSMPQKYQSAWTGACEGLVGASYKPLLFYATQLVKGVNYYFIAEQTLITNPIIRRVVKLVINEFEGKYDLVDVTEI